jgi:hypothetical protein
VIRKSEKAELFEREEDFRSNRLNCGLQIRPKELNHDTIFPQNRFKTLKRPLKSIVSKTATVVSGRKLRKIVKKLS